MIYSVIDKATQAEVYRYEAAAPVEWNGWEFVTHDHVVYTPPIEPGAPIPSMAVRIWSPLEFMRRFTQEERIAIRTAASQSAVIEDYLKILDLTTEVRSDDADTISALNMLEQVGLIGTGRAAEIISG